MKPNLTIQLKDGRKLGYAEYGDPKGKPLFYFHGWPTSRFQAQITDIPGKKLHIRVISIDRPGYGLSDFKPSRTLLEWPEDVIELADQLKIKKFSVMGVSGGGPYAAVCAYGIPQRLEKVAIVVGLAPTWIPRILDGMSGISKFGWEHYGKVPLMRRLAALFQYNISFYSPGIGIHRFLWGAKSDKVIYDQTEVRKLAQKSYREAFKQGIKGVEHDLKLYTTNWGFELNKIKAKVYLFYGEADKNVTLAMGKYYHEQVPNSTLITYPNEGHLISRTHCEEILKMLV